jgi:patatin-related protein
LAAFEPTQEIRFALVMYGGVSLAIYMNGITQELLHLVRATAPSDPMADQPTETLPDPESTEVVYRKLGQLLAHGCEPPASQPASADPVRTRFVVDIISGSSAGGINGVFLAKALANKQSIRMLKDLWVDEGAIDRLLNDRRVKEPKIPAPKGETDSLLSGPRMYWLLLDALDKMDAESPAEPSPLVEELDLWVTTTDLWGLTLPIKFTNGMAFERRYRNVFRFGYRTVGAAGEANNDFAAEENPMLAFAARCTSSFPFAFPPMLLTDTDPVLGAKERHTAREGSKNTRWGRFFPEYVQAGDDYALRPFSDGGDLDNKPFTWAIRNIVFRPATYPVHRKLAFIEPDPGHPEGEQPQTGRPDPVTSVRLAALLARQEGIRDDLVRVRDYNRVADQVAKAMEAVEDGFARDDSAPADTGTWLAGRDKRGRAKAESAPAQVYEQLKIGQAVDELASMVAGMTGIDEESDHLRAIELLVAAWVEQEFSAPADRRQFLLEYDFRYRIRRLNFLFRRADSLARLDARCDAFVERAGERRVPPEDRDEFLRALVTIKARLSEAFCVLRKGWKDLASNESLQRKAHELGISEVHLDTVLTGSPRTRSAGAAEQVDALPAACLQPALSAGERAKAVLSLPGVSDRLNAFAREVAESTEVFFPEAAAVVDGVLGAPGPSNGEPGETARATLRYYYDRFVAYDVVALPLLIGRTGEGAHVEVFRFSPEDAKGLSDAGAEKLAGSRLSHFGAFFDRAWRRWDVMWGRLDGAELLITSLLPKGHLLQAELLHEAQLAILREELAAPTEVIAAIAAELLGTDGGASPDPGVLQGIPKDTQTTLAQRTVAAGLDPETFLQRLRDFRGPPPGPDPAYTMKVGTRAASIVGNIVHGLSDQPGVGMVGRVLSRLGRVGWGLVELATPGGWPWKVVRRLVSLLVVLQLLLIVGGIVFNQPGATRLGWWTLGATVVFVVLRGLLAEFLRLRKFGAWSKVAVGVVAAVVVALTIVGGVRAVDGARDWVCENDNDWVRKATPFTCPATTVTSR